MKAILSNQRTAEERRAVEKIKIGPLIGENGTLQDNTKTMSEMLQK